MARFLTISLLFFSLFFPVGNGARAEKVALVVGINKYDHLGAGQQLQRAVNDARSVAQVLRRLGFKVDIGEDLDRSAFNRMWQSFLEQLSPGDEAAFYYSGHGIEIEGYNHLLPRDVPNISPGRQEQLRRESISVTELLLDLKKYAPQIKLVILDACRDNPLIAEELRSAGKRGLASVSDPPEGTFIMYSAGAGETALDRLPSNDPDPMNSVYTRNLLQLIKIPGLTLPDLARQLRVRVKEVASTIGHVQRPAYYDGLVGHYCIAGCEANASVRAGLPLSSALMAARGAEQRRRVASLVEDKDLKVSIDVMGEVIQKLRADYVELPSDRALMTSAIEAVAKQFGNDTTQTLVEKGIGKSRATTAIDDAEYPLLDVFGDVLEEALQNRTSAASIQPIVRAAIAGMLSGLDAHGVLQDAEAYRKQYDSMSGRFVGIGIEIRKVKDNKLEVIAPLDESPAAKAGILTNDRITHINGEPVDELTLAQAVDKIRGLINTNVTVTVMRDGQKTPFNVTIVRSNINRPGIKFELEPGGSVGYIKISQFTQQTVAALVQAVGKLQSLGGNQINGYVIDLRNNVGGLLDVAIAVTDKFLEKDQKIATLKGRGSQEVKRYISTSGDILNGQKLIVLINEGTASGAEILASALKDNKRATIVGVRSFGKASVQTIYPLRDKSAVRFTTQRFFTPNGRTIENTGVQPDVRIEKSSGGAVEMDVQLQKAIELAAAK
jgi:carboxyl-terminal processing protease